MPTQYDLPKNGLPDNYKEILPAIGIHIQSEDEDTIFVHLAAGLSDVFAGQNSQAITDAEHNTRLTYSLGGSKGLFSLIKTRFNFNFDLFREASFCKFRDNRGYFPFSGRTLVAFGFPNDVVPADKWNSLTEASRQILKAEIKSSNVEQDFVTKLPEIASPLAYWKGLATKEKTASNQILLTDPCQEEIAFLVERLNELQTRLNILALQCYEIDRNAAPSAQKFKP